MSDIKNLSDLVDRNLLSQSVVDHLNNLGVRTTIMELSQDALGFGSYDQIYLSSDLSAYMDMDPNFVVLHETAHYLQFQKYGMEGMTTNEMAKGKASYIKFMYYIERQADRYAKFCAHRLNLDLGNTFQIRQVMLNQGDARYDRFFGFIYDVVATKGFDAVIEFATGIPQKSLCV